MHSMLPIPVTSHSIISLSSIELRWFDFVVAVSVVRWTT